MTQPARDTSVKTLSAKFDMGSGEEKREQGLALKLRSTDVVIERIADFVDIKLDDELKKITEGHASLKFMQRHRNKFDDRLMREMSERLASLPPGSDSAKVRVGKVGEHAQHFSDELSVEIDAIWQQEIVQKFEFPDYRALIDSLV